jgi:3-oxoacyl-[acyl-carrier-protein] synthase-3
VAPDEVCASDLCLAAAERLLDEMNYSREQIGGVIFVTQTPDYVLPATSHVLHHHLGLPASAVAFDVNLGCSGYVYGLWLAASSAHSLNAPILLLVGDTINKLVSPEDQSVAMLFGDAGTASLLEPCSNDEEMIFEMGADGSGAENLIVPAGGFRRRRDQRSGERAECADGNVRSDEDLHMNGPEIFAFTIRRVPAMVKNVLTAAGCSAEEIDAFVFHQANAFMLDHLLRKMKLPRERVAMALNEYGNTSGASIPLTMTAAPLRDRLRKSRQRLLLAGFGVGYSWAAAVVSCGPMAIPDIVDNELA